jgi:D-lactate dehydrogenase
MQRSVLAASGLNLRAQLERFLDREQILDRPLERIAHAHDASFYRLVPQAVVHPRSVDQVSALFRWSHAQGVPIVFRAGGTSLSGQAITDGVLVDVSRHFRRVVAEDEGRRVRTEVGVVGAHVNRELAPYGRKMGPDPASINSAQMGGILANNASGMCCGVTQNAYHTLASLRFLLPSGTFIDTAAADADEQLRAREPALHAGLSELRRAILAAPALAERIRRKYRMKNTCGYALNAFIDFERPIDIFSHILIGSEGTLAFVADAVLETVPDLPVKHTGLLFFPSVHAACAAIVPLRDAGARALELMDRASLRSVEDKAGMPPLLRTLPPDAAALLVEFQTDRPEARPALAAAAREAAASLTLLAPAQFTDDAAEQAQMWKIRAGMFPSVGSMRRSGTSVLIEDVAFPVEHLADAAVGVQRLLVEHGYHEGILFGHAKDGNLHFVITQSFNDRPAIDRYARFIDDIVDLVVRRYDGALKAEHGTGRNMAPFVETEWGGEALAIMRRLKKLADPRGLLNPGVILPDSPSAHIEDLKPMHSVEPLIDKCIECGACEPRCPSRELTLTPRQRIVVRREMARLAVDPRGPVTLDELEDDFQYHVLDTCAVDGLCSTACPVGIDTGVFVKHMRSLDKGGEGSVDVQVAQQLVPVEKLLRFGLRAASAVPSSLLVGLTRVARAVGGSQIPEWSREMPRAAKGAPRTDAKLARAVYFPSCLSRTMGHLPGEPRDLSLAEALVAVAARADVPVHIPADVDGVCCGHPFQSKGYVEGHRQAVNTAIARMWTWSDGGRLPVVVDTSPCTYGLLHAGAALDRDNRERMKTLRIVDVVQFAHDELLPRLTVRRKTGSVAIHPVCSVVKMGLGGKLETVARACSEKVVHPPSAGCCGFAGDRGFLVPELTASATRHEAAEVKAAAPEGCYSSSRTCEIGMTRATGEVYRSFIYLLEEASRP